MPEHQSMQTDLIYEELSAYLDGELDTENVRRVEDRLARDVDYRSELQRMERAWGLLDRLPRATVDEAFTKTTIEMVALAASEDAQAVLAEQPRRRRRRRLLGVVGMLAAGLIGFVIGTQVWTDPNEQLLRDLRVLQNFERYYQAGEIEFLRMLEKEGLFEESDGDHGS